MKIVDYIILSGQKRVDFITQVQRYILDGRQPFGPLSLAFNETQIIFHQAMVKYEETKTEHKENSIIEILYHQRGVLIDGFHKIQSKKMLEELVLMIAKIDDEIKEYTKR